MKKILILVCVAALLVCAVAANAYVINVAVNPSSGGNLTIGTPTNSQVAYADNTNLTNQSWIVAVKPSDQSLNKSLYSTSATSWTFKVWTEDAKTSVTFSLWGQSAANVADLAGKTWAVYNGTTELGRYTWAATSPAAGSSSNPLITFALDTTGATFASPITLTFAPAAVPEPGSILALGSGLVGLVGFAIRRRK